MKPSAAVERQRDAGASDARGERLQVAAERPADDVYVSLCHGSLCTLLDGLGAMNGLVHAAAPRVPAAASRRSR